MVTAPLESTQEAVCIQVVHVEFRKVKFRKIWAKRLVFTNQSSTLQEAGGKKKTFINFRNLLNCNSM